MGKTSKPLDIIVDERLYDLPEIQALGEKGHTIKKLLSHGYDAILAPKAYNLTEADLTANPKLLDVALERIKQERYPKKSKEVEDVVENKEAPASTDAKGDDEKDAAPKPAPRKRKPRAKKAAVPSDGQAGGVDSSTVTAGDTAGGGK